jgi:hypothetical protein
MKKWVALLVAVLIGIALALYFFAAKHAPSAASPQRTVEQQNAAVASALANQSTNTVAIIESNFARVQAVPVAAHVTPGSAAEISIPPAGQAQPLLFTNIPPEIAVENMGRAIHQYGQMFGGNPVGNNADFTRQLSGQNPKHINFINAEAGMQVNENGELVDPWGTPYFFHQISGSDTEVRSAGPDKIMYTSDDIVK